jgi:hypothetical protein
MSGKKILYARRSGELIAFRLCPPTERVWHKRRIESFFHRGSTHRISRSPAINPRLRCVAVEARDGRQASQCRRFNNGLWFLPLAAFKVP